MKVPLVSEKGEKKKNLFLCFSNPGVFIREERSELQPAGPACSLLFSAAQWCNQRLAGEKTSFLNQRGGESTKTDITSGLFEDTIAFCCYGFVYACVWVWIAELPGLIKSILARPPALMRRYKAPPYIQLNVHYIPLLDRKFSPLPPYKWL